LKVIPLIKNIKMNKDELMFELNLAVCAYELSNEMDVVPNWEESTEYPNEYDTRFDKNDCIAAAKQYEGSSRSNMINTILNLIDKLYLHSK
jgi:hypothetical protein